MKASNTAAFDFFGAAVALSGDGLTLAVGAYGEDNAAIGVAGDEADDSAPWAGAVYVFAKRALGWDQDAYVKASNTDAFDLFGISVSLSADGEVLAAGAYFEASAATGIDGDEDNDSASLAGAAYVLAKKRGAGGTRRMSRRPTRTPATPSD